MIELRNETDHEFIDISSELWRRYDFADGDEVLIELPLCLSVSASGGARILDTEGLCHYVPEGWIHLEWRVREGAPHFVK